MSCCVVMFCINTGWKSRDSVPKLVDDYMAKKLKVDEFITHNFKLEQVNDAFAAMKEGKW